MIQFGFRIIWRIMEISEGVICNIRLDLHSFSDDIQPHSVIVKYLNPWTNMQIHTLTVVQMRGGGWNPLRSFWYVAVFWNDFNFSGKPLIFLTRWGIFYGWWRCWRPVQQWSPSWILPKIRNPPPKKITITKLVSKSARGMNEQLLKTSGADVLSSRETTEKNLMWEGGGTPLPPVVYPRVNL